MNNFKCTLSYDGANYTGWQHTGCGKSIEEVVRNALETILRHLVPLQATSRTDRGVHAWGQTLNFYSPTKMEASHLLYRLNQLLPQEIAIRSIEIVPLSFHATMNAIKKQYHYDICYGPIQLPFNRFTSWHFPHELQIEKMKEGASFLIGTHDFSSFCNERSLWTRSPMCTIEEIQIIPLDHSRLRISICGDHFLYKMVRNLAGTLAYIGCSKLPPQDLPAILAARHRPLASMTAPAHGLMLYRTSFKNQHFEPA